MYIVVIVTEVCNLQRRNTAVISGHDISDDQIKICRF